MQFKNRGGGASVASFDDHLTETCRRRGDVREVLTGLLSRFVVGCTCGQRSTRNRVQLCTCCVPLPARGSGPTRDHIWKSHGRDRVTELLFTAVGCDRGDIRRVPRSLRPQMGVEPKKSVCTWFHEVQDVAAKSGQSGDLPRHATYDSRGESKSYIQTCSAPLRNWLRSLKVLSHIDVISG